MDTYSFNKETETTKLRKCIVCNEKKECYTFKNVGVCEEHLDKYLSSKITCTHCKNKFTRRNEVWENKASKTTFCSASCINYYKQDQEAKDELDKWLREYHGLEKLNPYIYKQMQEYRNNKMTYQGMKFALEWWVNIKGQRLEAHTLGIVPMIYSQAREYYQETVKMQQLREDMDKQGFKNVTQGTRVKIDTSSKVLRNKLLINKIEGIN